MSTFIARVPGFVTLYMGSSHKEAHAAWNESSTTGCQLIELNDLGQQRVLSVKRHHSFSSLPVNEIRNIQRRARMVQF